MLIDRKSDYLSIAHDNLNCRFNNSDGSLVYFGNSKSSIRLNGITPDIGCDGKYLLKNLDFDSMLDKHTWDLPGINPLKNGLTPKFEGFEHSDSSLTAKFSIHPLKINLIYSFEAKCLKVFAEIKNTGNKPLWINGLAFITNIPEDVIFNFPSNVPCYPEMQTSQLGLNEAVSSGLINGCIHSKISGVDFNLAFVDPVEKWGCGVWRDEKQSKMCYVPNLEVMMEPDRKIECGYLYLQLPESENPYVSIRDLYENLGYKHSTDGINTGIMYSGHPSGTMDKNFPLKLTMNEYAKNLDELRDIGIDHIWLLPIFDHGKENVYHSTDQAVIDARYGTDDDVRAYCDKAHKLGMTVLFDYVPHGPSPNEPLAKNNPDWCAKRQDGSLHDEWNCVSFDYNHPGYLKYTTDLVYDHVKRFDIDGARIDCAMGGLSNWRPYADNRPSASSVQAGVNISKAIRDGFLKGGKKPLNMPENFNPVPCYYPYTDVFYGMNLYRVFCEIDNLVHDDPAEYVRLLTSWLEREYYTTPEGYTKMRFLGNHDTVSWVWQSARATKYYGTETAKALWAIISLIDGMVMIYQGDEDPKWYLYEGGPILKDFFKKLFSDRKKHLRDDMKTGYIQTGIPVMAFIRHNEREKRLVLVNLSNEDSKVSFDDIKISNPKILAGDGEINKNSIEIGSYSYLIMEIY